MAGSGKVDPKETAKKKLERAYGPGCNPPKKPEAEEQPADFLNGVDQKDAYEFYIQIRAATDLLERKAGEKAALGFLINALDRLNKEVQEQTKG
jgi:hypothetical protein